MDLSIFDHDSAIKQRYLEIEDRAEAAKEAIANSGWAPMKFQDMYDISWIYHENGLEGVVLTYPEIKSAIEKKIVSDVSLLPTYTAIKNQKICIDMMRARAQQKRFIITIPFLKELHGLLVNDPDMAGVYRKDIPIHRTYFHEIAQPVNIPTLLQKALDYLKAKPERDQHPIEFAANVHHRFMRVFPFSQHSGTIGRLCANFVLIRAGYMPIIIHSSDRQHYYEALRGQERDFRLFMAEVMESSLDNAVRFFTDRSMVANLARAAR
ncbi:MAG: Fic family protein [Deltaproteobacteria bacterium]|nr:Fic family protein [Deltaproteobacteria bacterium]